MLIPVWQPRLHSSHQLAALVGAECGEPATHTGTLDPMAAGVLLVLTGADRFLKSELQWPKVYQFSILWGIATDSGDQLGRITSWLPTAVVNTLHTETQITNLETQLASIIEQFPLTYDQQLPHFSARRIAGKSSFELAKTQQPISIKTRSVTLNNLELLSSTTLSVKEILTNQEQALQQLTGDFRQQAIIRNWREQLATTSEQQLIITHHQVTTSPGTYIRQLVQDLAQQLNIPATTYSITRIQNGQFTRADCFDWRE